MTIQKLPQKPELNGHKLDFVTGKLSIILNQEAYLINERSLHNLGLTLANHDSLKNKLIYDIFADDIIIQACPPWENNQTFAVHPWRDEDTTNLRMWLDRLGMKVSKNDTIDVVIATAKNNVVNPPKEYFNKLKWDGTERLNGWLSKYGGCCINDKTYLELVGSKWMIGCVKRIYEPGAKFDTALLLEGDQNAGKSTIFSTLAEIGGVNYFIDEDIDFNGKESLMKLQGKLICEMAELASWRTASNEKVKAWVSRRTDIYRPPYGRKPIERPRMFVLAGSLNSSGGVLRDPTGNRRYWIARVGKILLEELARDREQLWAEAVHRYKQGERVWLVNEEFDLAKNEQDMQFDADILAEKIEETIKELEFDEEGFSINKILDRWGLTIEKKNNGIKHRIADHLTFIGYELARPRLGNKGRPGRWRKKEKPDNHQLGD